MVRPHLNTATDHPVSARTKVTYPSVVDALDLDHQEVTNQQHVGADPEHHTAIVRDLLVVGDQDPVLLTVTDRDPVLHTVTDQDPVLRTVTDQDPELRTVTGQDLELHTVTDRDPELHTVTDRDPELRTVTDRDLDLRIVTDPNQVHLEVIDQGHREVTGHDQGQAVADPDRGQLVATGQGPGPDHALPIEVPG